MINVEGAICYPYIDRSDNKLTFSTPNTGNIFVANDKISGDEHELTVNENGETLRSISWMDDDTLKPLIGLSIDTEIQQAWPQYLEIGQRCALLINGAYYIYTRGQNGYSIDVLISSKYEQMPLIAVYTMQGNITTIQGIAATEDVYLVSEEDILNPVGWYPFPAPLPDHIGTTTEYIGLPTMMTEI